MSSNTAARRAAVAAGEAAESFVAEHLAGLGWRVLDRRWRGAAGELDLVVARAGQLRVVEVKLRKPDDPVGLEAITGRKLDRLERAADAWLQDHEDPYDEICLMLAWVEPGPAGWTVQLYDDPV